MLVSENRLLDTHQTASYGYDGLPNQQDETTCSIPKASGIEPEPASLTWSLVSTSTVRCYSTALNQAHAV